MSIHPTILPNQHNKIMAQGRELRARTRNQTVIGPRTLVGGGSILGPDASQIDLGTLTAAEIQAGTITADNIAARTITAGLIAANTITANEIAAATITGDRIAAGTITADKIAAGVITAGEIDVDRLIAELAFVNTQVSDNILSRLVAAANITTSGLQAVSANMGTLTSGRIRIQPGGSGPKMELGDTIPTSGGNVSGIVGADGTGAITFKIDATTGNVELKGTVKTGSTGLGNFSDTLNPTTQITDGTLPGAKLVADSVTATQIAANAITASEILANTITAAKIAANTITASQIASNTLTANEIAANAITADEIAANVITAKVAAGEVIQTFPIGATGAAKTGVQINNTQGITGWKNEVQNLLLHGSYGLHLLTDRTINDTKSDDRAIDWVDTIAAANPHASIYSHSKNDGSSRVLSAFAVDAPAAASRTDCRMGVWNDQAPYWQSFISVDTTQGGPKEVSVMVGDNVAPKHYGYRTIAKRASRTAPLVQSDFAQSPSHVGLHIRTGAVSGVGVRIPKGSSSKAFVITFGGGAFIPGTAVVPKVTATAFREVPGGGATNIFSTITAVSSKGFQVTTQQAQNYNVDKNVQFRIYWIAAGTP